MTDLLKILLQVDRIVVLEDVLGYPAVADPLGEIESNSTSVFHMYPKFVGTVLPRIPHLATGSCQNGSLSVVDQK